MLEEVTAAVTITSRGKDRTCRGCDMDMDWDLVLRVGIDLAVILV
jgi:hypothetical protein